jgi:PBP1b-binding outer membrane lipoprotein LpoB
MKKALIPIAFAALFLGGCFADNYEKLHPVKSTPAKCDTTGVISFGPEPNAQRQMASWFRP